jgi:hypothetical protein
MSFISSTQSETPLPGLARLGTTEATQLRDKEIFYAMEPDPLIKGGTIAKVGAGAIIASGTVLGRIAASGKYGVYDDTAVNGLQVAIGVLWTHVNTTLGDVEGNIIFSGVLKLDQLVGLDNAAIADLNGRVDAVANFLLF